MTWRWVFSDHWQNHGDWWRANRFHGVTSGVGHKTTQCWWSPMLVETIVGFQHSSSTGIVLELCCGELNVDGEWMYKGWWWLVAVGGGAYRLTPITDFCLPHLSNQWFSNHSSNVNQWFQPSFNKSQMKYPLAIHSISDE